MYIIHMIYVLYSYDLGTIIHKLEPGNENNFKGQQLNLILCFLLFF